MKYSKTKYPMVVHELYYKLKCLKNLSFSKYSVNNTYNNLSCNPFFIIGSGRSGNTLLRAILANHSKISIPPESYVLPTAVKKFKAYNFLPWNDLIKIIVGEFESHNQFFTWELNMYPVYERLQKLENKDRTLAKIIDDIYCYYSEQKSPSFEMWGDKTPLNTLNLGWINCLYNDAKYIHIIRDGRDVVSSYLKMGRYNTIADACERWNDSINLATNFGITKPDNYIEVKYEDLVSNPMKEVQKICRFLNIEFENNMLLYFNDVKKLGDTKLKHHSNLTKPIDKSSIGKWRKNLSPAQKKEAERLLCHNLKIYDYI